MNQLAACYLPPLWSIRNIFNRRRSVKRSIIIIGCLLLLLMYSIAKASSNEAKVLLVFAPQLGASLAAGNFIISFLSAAVRSSTVLFLSQDSSLFLKAPISQSKLFLFRFVHIFIGTQWSVWILLLPFLIGLLFGAESISEPLLIISSAIAAQITGTACAILLVVVGGGFAPINRVREGVLTLLVLFLISLSAISFFLEFFPEAKTLSALTVPSVLAKIKNTPSLTHLFYFWTVATVCSLLLSGFVFAKKYITALSRLSDHRREATRISITLPRLIPISGTLRAQASKEFRLLLRNSSQVLQVLIFLSGITMYLIQARIFGKFENLPPHMLPLWDSGKTVIHASISGVLLCGICSRFVFPSFSLEGPSIWIFQTVPITAQKMLHQRILIWGSVLFVLGEILVLAIGCALNLSFQSLCWNITVFAVLIPILVTIAMTCGALFVRFDWEHPGAVTGSWGSLLTFIFCFCALLAVLTASVPLLLFNIITFPSFDFISGASIASTLKGLIIGGTLITSFIMIRKASELGVAAIESFGEVKALRRGKFIKKGSKKAH